MKVSELERGVLISLMKKKTQLKEFDNEIVDEAEAHSENGMISSELIKKDIECKGKHHTKLRKSALTWSQRTSIIMFCLHPFFGEKILTLVCYTNSKKKRHKNIGFLILIASKNSHHSQATLL